MTVKTIQKNKNLIQAFKVYRKRYLSMGKMPNITKLLPEVVFRTMRLEGESITRKEVKTLYK